MKVRVILYGSVMVRGMLRIGRAVHRCMVASGAIIDASTPAARREVNAIDTKDVGFRRSP
jgi:hypothetical protein